MKDYRVKKKPIPDREGYVDIMDIVDNEQLFLNEISGSWAGRAYRSSNVLLEVLEDKDEQITFRSVHSNVLTGTRMVMSQKIVNKHEFKKYPEQFYYTRVR